MSQPTLSSPAPARFWDASHNRAVRNIAAVRDQVLADFTLSSAEWFVMDVAQAARDRGISVGEVAAIMDVQTTYIALVLRHLQAKKLIKTVPSKRDRRVHLVQLTNEGQEVLKQSDAALTRAFAVLTDELVVEDLKSYSRVIDTLAFSGAKA